MAFKKKNLLTSSMFMGLAVLSGAVLSTVITPAVAQAQTAPTAAPTDPEDPEADVLDEVVITGSRIPRPQFEGVIPGVQVRE
ncbi:MAG TPA: hypothetical protein VLJ13_05555, partial [Brevundimonas sp.]|nr:hypothetical protein [Brevundimonas sp.]